MRLRKVAGLDVIYKLPVRELDLYRWTRENEKADHEDDNDLNDGHLEMVGKMSKLNKLDITYDWLRGGNSLVLSEDSREFPGFSLSELLLY